jgi:hypothetical protein
MQKRADTLMTESQDGVLKVGGKSDKIHLEIRPFRIIMVLWDAYYLSLVFRFELIFWVRRISD